MQLNKVKEDGDMYPFVTHTGNVIRGFCKDHNCIYCYMRGHPSWTQDDGAGNIIDRPYYFVESQLKGCPVAMQEFDADGSRQDRFIFLGSSTDPWARSIPDKWITRILTYCRRHQGQCCRLHGGKVKWLFQSKDPARFLEFVDLMPADVMLATTIETNRDARQGPKGEVSKAPPVGERADALAELATRGFPILVSVEPIMRFDLVPFLKLLFHIGPTMISIGADSRGEDERRGEPIYEPVREDITRLVKELEALRIPVVQKRNLKRILEPRVPR